MSLTEKVYNKILQARKPKPKLRYSNTPLTGMSLYGTFNISNSTWTLNENNKTSSDRNS